jgi:hypothetical protein
MGLSNSSIDQMTGRLVSIYSLRWMALMEEIFVSGKEDCNGFTSIGPSLIR